LQNVKRRLKLIYGKNYVLNINDGAETYGIHLVIPL
jgi:LytS/YehU family sensor histidine kinase